MARAAGVSLTTASRALNPDGDHPVRVDTRQRVLDVAARMEYRPNLMARGLRHRRLPTIAVIVHDLTDPYFAEIVRGAAQEASQHGFLTFVCSSGRDPAMELRYVEMLRRSRVAAVLFAAGGLEEDSYKRAIRREVEGIRQYGGAVVALAPRSERWPTEVTDNCGGARLATRHLLELGHERIAFIAGPTTVRTSAEREAGYLEAMAEAGLEPLVERGDFTMRSGAVATAKLLERGAQFSAIFVSSDTMAVSCLAELARRGLRVPQDISVVGFGDMPGWEFWHPSLTTVRIGLAEIGAAGTRRALELLAGRDRRPRVRVHPVSLVIRETTRRAREWTAKTVTTA